MWRICTSKAPAARVMVDEASVASVEVISCIYLLQSVVGHLPSGRFGGYSEQGATTSASATESLSVASCSGDA